MTVTAGTLAVGGTVDDGASTYSLTKAGTGALTLGGSNSFKGGVTLSAGILNINHAGALGTGTLAITGPATIDNTSGAAITNSHTNAQNWNADFTFTGTKDLNLGTGAVTLGASPQVTVTASTLTVGGAISGSGYGLTKAGNGTLALTGANTYTGTTTVNAGTLLLAGASHTGGGNYTINSAGTLSGNGSITLAGANTVTVQPGGTIGPGASTGTLEFGSPVILSNGAQLTYSLGLDPSLNPVGGFMKFTDLTLGTGTTVNLKALTGWDDGTYPPVQL